MINYEDDVFEPIPENFVENIINSEDIVDKCNSLLESVIHEMNITKPNKIKIDSKPIKFGLELDGSRSTGRNFDKDPYFKLFVKGSDSVHAGPQNMTRIAILKPEYSSHNNDSIGSYKLSNKEKEQLISVLKSPLSGTGETLGKDENKKEVENVWEYILAISNKISNLKPGDKTYLDQNTPIPDYTKL